MGRQPLPRFPYANLKSLKDLSCAFKLFGLLQNSVSIREAIVTCTFHYPAAEWVTGALCKRTNTALYEMRVSIFFKSFSVPPPHIYKHKMNFAVIK